ncbi:hypothetical protein AVEN_34349-2-1, partial [Araneus ventricosus]
ENSVTVVPCTWIEGDMCAWPPFKSLKKIEDCAKNLRDPEPSWQRIRVLIMKSTVVNLDSSSEDEIHHLPPFSQIKRHSLSEVPPLSGQTQVVLQQQPFREQILEVVTYMPLNRQLPANSMSPKNVTPLVERPEKIKDESAVRNNMFSAEVEIQDITKWLMHAKDRDRREILEHIDYFPKTIRVEKTQNKAELVPSSDHWTKENDSLSSCNRQSSTVFKCSAMIALHILRAKDLLSAINARHQALPQHI